MQTTITLKAQKRVAQGKGAARRLRAAGKLPAIVYGPGHDAVPVAVEPKEVRQILTSQLGRNTVVTLDVDGEAQLAMLKSFEYHPISRDLEHADFYTVKLERAIVVEVPFTTQGKAKGVAAGGILRQVFRKLPVKCTPDKIPAKVEVDVSGLELNSSLHVRDLSLPAGVVVMLDPGQTIVSVVTPEKEEKAAAQGAGASIPPGAPAGAAGASVPPAAGKGAAPAAGKGASTPPPAGKDAKKK